MRFRSKWATMVADPQDVRDRKKRRAFGVMLHTTGRGLLRRANRHGIEPIEAAINVYTARGAYFPHYVVDQHGDAVQIADERERASHAGVPARQRALYLSGRWATKVNRATLARWRARWRGVKSPSHIYPTRSPNSCYIGIELIPDGAAGFSLVQMVKAARLVDDILSRHCPKQLAEIIDDADLNYQIGFNRIIGHEDAEPLERWNRLGGWDPGALRARPRFSWFTLLSETWFAGYDRILLANKQPRS